MTFGNTTFEVIALLIAASHIGTIALVILWIGLRKPLSAGEFWRRFKKEFLTLRPPA